MVKYTGKKNVQVQITNPDGSVYPYPLTHGRFVAFPFTRGDGKYTIKVLEQMSGSDYALALSKHFSVELENKLSPFLYPNQYVQYTNSSSAVKLGRRLSEKSDTDLGYVESVYDYIINNVAYDKELAEDTPTNYVPDIDKTLRTKKGICFDYAALMTAMLRSQGIPTKLEVGYAGDVYHAWISVYLKDKGWVDDVISFDGEKWTLMDPTLGASNKAEDVKDFVGDGSNYTTKYIY
jgi:transglutaminase-like putative cysteine protease